MKEERHEIRDGDEKRVTFKQTYDLKNHGAHLEIHFNPNSCFFQIYYHNKLMFEYNDDILFEKIYYKSKFLSDHILIHIIFDNNSVLYEELDYLEFFFIVNEKDVYFMERLISDTKYQIFMNNLGKDYQLMNDEYPFIDISCIFENEYYIDLIKNQCFSVFPQYNLSLEHFIMEILNMKVFSF